VPYRCRGGYPWCAKPIVTSGNGDTFSAPVLSRRSGKPGRDLETNNSGIRVLDRVKCLHHTPPSGRSAEREPPEDFGTVKVRAVPAVPKPNPYTTVVGLGIGTTFTFLLAFSLYFGTLAPGVMWGDSAKLTLLAYEGVLRPGLSYHSLHAVLAGFFAELLSGDYALRVNLFSAMLGAAGISFVFAAAREAGFGVLASCLSAMALALSHTYWSVSVVAESYPVANAAGAAAVWLTFRWLRLRCDWLVYIAAVLPAAAFAAHPTAVLLLPGIFAVVAIEGGGVGRWRRLAAMVGWTMIGMLTYAGIVAGSVAQVGWESTVENWRATRIMESMWFGWSGSQMYLKILALLAGLFVYQFPFFGLPLGLWGVRLSWQRHSPLFFLSAVTVVVGLGFASLYGEKRQYLMSQQVYLCFALWVACGLDEVIRRRQPGTIGMRAAWTALAVLGLVLIPATYAGTVAALRSAGISVIPSRQLVHRDNERYFLFPPKALETGPREFAVRSLEQIGSNGIIIADFTPLMVLRYYQVVCGLRQDVTLWFVDAPLTILDLEQTRKALETGRDVLMLDAYGTGYTDGELKRKFHLEPSPPLMRMKLRRDGL